MPGRRIILFVVLLVLIGAVASATVPREHQAAPVEAQPAPQLGPAAGVVDARLPAKKAVRATVGEIVHIDVRDGADDVAQVLALGVAEPVGPGIPGQLVFDADHPGRFAVTLRDASRRIGTVVVRAAG